VGCVEVVHGERGMRRGLDPSTENTLNVFT